MTKESYMRPASTVDGTKLRTGLLAGSTTTQDPNKANIPLGGETDHMDAKARMSSTLD